MAGIEDQIRDSLRHRAQDVEATPVLWQEVDRRIARRKRFLALSWALAGAAAVLAAVVVVPGLLGDGGPVIPEIAPADRLPAMGVVPSAAVVADDGGLALLDLRTGERTSLAEGDGATVHQIAVQPGSTLDDYRVAMVQVDGTSGAHLTFVAGPDDESSGMTQRAGREEGGSVSGVLEAHAAAPDFAPTLRWAPEGDLLAYTVPAGDGEASLLIGPSPDGFDGFLDPEQASDVARLDPDAVLLDWVGAVAQPGDRSVIYLRGGDGSVDELAIEIGPDGAPTAGDARAFDPSDRVFAVASPHGPDALYVLRVGPEGGNELVWIEADGDGVGAPMSRVDLSGLTGDVERSGLWLDAKQDAALVGDGERVWLLAHDGRGTFAEPVALAGDIPLAALLDAPRPGVADPDADGPAIDPDPDPDPEPGPGPSEGSGDGPATDLALPAPVLVGAGQELRVLDAGGATVRTVEFPFEGESFVAGLAVRPGSTVDDLTAAILTTAEGMWDLRHLRILDGEATVEVFPPAYRPGDGGSAGEGLAVRGPVWSPDGDSLAWLEFGTGDPTLRTIGWSDGPGTGERATDNAAFTLDLPPGLVLDPAEWVAVGGSTEIRATTGEPDDVWYAVPLLRQGDGALSVSDPSVEQRSVPASGEAGAAAIAGVGPDGQPAWMVRGTTVVRDPYGTSEKVFALPDGFSPGEGMPTIWLRPVGPGVLVGSPTTSVAYYGAPDGSGSVVRLAGAVAFADAIR